VRRSPLAIVSRYARALFAIAKQQNVLAAVRSDLQSLVETWQAYPELVQLIGNPGLGQARVSVILDTLCTKINAHALTRSFMHVLLTNDRLMIVLEVHDYFDKLWSEDQGEIDVAVTTAVPVSDALKQDITAHLAKSSGKKPSVTWDHDPNLLGGIIVRWPDRVFDGSLARKLDNLKTRMAESVAASGH
jgi:F-type H+-transporting ATPase subunit delta